MFKVLLNLRLIRYQKRVISLEYKWYVFLRNKLEQIRKSDINAARIKLLSINHI